MSIYLLALGAALTIAQPVFAGNVIRNGSVVANSTDPIKRGEALTDVPVVDINEVLANAEQYTESPIIIEGSVRAVCERKGCWMELTPKKGDHGVRVTFKDYGFFVPTTSKGMKVKAQGQVVVKVMSKDEVDHYVSEGATIKRNPDGTANEVTFVASGVELRKK